MNQFIKFMFASFLGTLITFLVLFLVFFAMIAGIVAMAESEEVAHLFDISVSDKIKAFLGKYIW